MAADLTEGERRVFKAYLEEETHEKAAARLEISTQTLKNHLGSIYRKVDRHKAHSAIYRMAIERGCDPLAPAEGDNPTARITGRFRPTEIRGSSMLDQNTHEDTDPSPLAEVLEQPDEVSPPSLLEESTE